MSDDHIQTLKDDFDAAKARVSRLEGELAAAKVAVSRHEIAIKIMDEIVDRAEKKNIDAHGGPKKLQDKLYNIILEADHPLSRTEVVVAFAQKYGEIDSTSLSNTLSRLRISGRICRSDEAGGWSVVDSGDESHENVAEEGKIYEAPDDLEIDF